VIPGVQLTPPSRLPLRIVAVIPTYNNALTVEAVIAGSLAHIPDVIVVNDGSTDGSAVILRELAEKTKSLTVITFTANRGKGCALKAGFAKAAELGFTNAITLDADGQHFPLDIPAFLENVARSPEKLYIGDRVITDADAKSSQPLRSSAGAKFGAFWYKFITGIPIADTQCGFRAYPVSAVLALTCKGSRFEYEQEVLIKAAWAGIPVQAVPIHLHYEPRGKAVSHFRPVRDFFRIFRVNSKAAMTKIFLPFLILELPGSTWKQKVVALFKRELSANLTPKSAAASLSLGVFIGFFPIYGFQVITLVALSFLLRLNRPLAFLGVCVSSPPFLPFIIAIAVAIGGIMVPASWHAVVAHMRFASLLAGGIDWFFGSIILSIVCAGICWILCYPLFLKLSKRRKSAGGK
jgi:glycosyltransferase involved in cell wall biosynthesis